MASASLPISVLEDLAIPLSNSVAGGGGLTFSKFVPDRCLKLYQCGIGINMAAKKLTPLDGGDV